MCPDRQIISVYLDGELPSPWKEKLEAHADGCRACRDRIDLYASIRTRLLDPAPDPSSPGDPAWTPMMENAKSRVWRNLVRDMPHQKKHAENRRPWRLTMPVPAAAAALAAVALLAVLAGGSVLSAARTNSAMATLNTDMRGVLPVVDMAGVLQYLETQESAADVVIIRLPDSKSFIPAGEPALVRAADYMRSDAP